MLNIPKQQHGQFNLSDLKADMTQHFDSPNFKSNFEPSEISARSTTLMQKNAPRNLMLEDNEFDAIMRSSSSTAVQNKYRESMGRLSFFPRTADMSMRTSMNSNAPKMSVGDYWDGVQVETNSFAGKNMSVASDDFRPAEQMMDKLYKDGIEQEQEYAPVPQVHEKNSNESNWESRNSTRQPEMSFGQYCQDFLGSNNIRDLYNNKSPSKRNRVALVELDNSEPQVEANRFEISNLQKLISKFTSES